ncbi:MAG: twin transmembrane helix small protein [Steroidobacteraceae bacterium]
MDYVIGLAFVGILGALAMAGVFMLRDGRDGKPRSEKMMHALALRIGLSVLLFVFILLSWWLGWIHPTGIPLGR